MPVANENKINTHILFQFCFCSIAFFSRCCRIYRAWLSGCTGGFAVARTHGRRVQFDALDDDGGIDPFVSDQNNGKCASTKVEGGESKSLRISRVHYFGH
eukprot:scaffold5057_cov134-Skeletonema_marinoi.AAC.18